MLNRILQLSAVAALLAATSHSVNAFVIPPDQAPDAGATALLLGMGAAGLVAVRRFIGKR